MSNHATSTVLSPTGATGGEHSPTPGAGGGAGGSGGVAAFVSRHHFLLRRLHSLTGIMPIGVFLIEHLITNSAILRGGEHYQHDIDFIYGLPGLLMMEIFGIWLPIAFHAILGTVYTFSGVPNSLSYGYQSNWRYTMMRVTGIIGFVYIFLHIATLRWGWSFGAWNTPFEPGNAADQKAVVTTAQALQFAAPWVMILYVIGTLSLVFHFANGLWTSAITWGVTITVQAQRRWGYVCAALGLLLAAAGLAAIYAFYTFPIGSLPAVTH